MTTPFITPDDEYAARSKDPKAIGQLKINTLLQGITVNSTDADIDAVVKRVKDTRDVYLQWYNFYNDLAQRKARLVAFMAMMQLDVAEIAAGLQTTPQAVAAFMTLRAQAEQKRITELTALWNSGQLPDRPVLSEPLPQVTDAVSPVSSPDSVEPTEPTATEA